MSYFGSGFLSKSLDRILYCESCDKEFDAVIDFDDGGWADMAIPCPSCEEVVFYKEELNG